MLQHIAILFIRVCIRDVQPNNCLAANTAFASGWLVVFFLCCGHMLIPPVVFEAQSIRIEETCSKEQL